MGARGAPRSSRGGGGLPTPLLIVLVTCLAGMMVLSATHLAGGGSGVVAPRTQPRLLLQGGGGGEAAGAEGGLHAGAGDDGPALQALRQAGALAGLGASLLVEPLQAPEEDAAAAAISAHQLYEGAAGGAGSGAPVDSSDADGGDGGWFEDGGGGEEGGAGGQAAEEGQLLPEEVTLGPNSDLATFAEPGTHCVVTPAHGKVALLFLTSDGLPHDMTWTAWMREAQGLLPRGSLAGEQAFCLKQCDALGACEQRCGRAAACNPLCLEALQAELGPSRSAHVLQQQHLFSVYVHSKITLTDYPEDSVFHGRLIPDRLTTKAGTHTMAAAAKKLLEAATLDQRNERFVLISETTVPLYHPALFYEQLMSEAKSRVDACAHEGQFTHPERSSPAMSSERFDPERHWRLSSQWWILTRKHAELVTYDSEVVAQFSRHCYVGQDEELGRRRECISDQHYFPSLLASYGLDNETTCDPTGGTWQQWVDGAAEGDTATDLARGAVQREEGQVAGHMMMFQPGHVNEGLIATIRQSPGGPPDAHPSDESELCDGWAAATQAARDALLDMAAVNEESCYATLGNADFLQANPFADAAMDPRCLLLAREFSQYAAKWVHRVYRSCTAGLGVLTCSPQLTDRDTRWWS